jgi:hypothetical protein
MAITRSDELRHSPATRDPKSSSPVIAIIIRSLNTTLFFSLEIIFGKNDDKSYNLRVFLYFIRVIKND